MADKAPFDLTKLSSDSFPKDPALTEALGTKFVLRRSRAMDKVEIGARQMAMLGGLSVGAINTEAASLAYMIATLAVVMVTPKDFPWDEVMDELDIIDLYNEWTAWNATFRRVRAGEGGGSEG